MITLVERENEDRETESIMYDNTNGDTLSKSEVLYLKLGAGNGKEVYTHSLISLKQMV